MKISILTDNRVEKQGLLAEHGLSVLLEDNGLTILFDTGHTDVYLHNAKQMGIDLSRVQHIVFSHGHFDHCGGLKYFPYTQAMPPVYLTAAALENKYGTSENGLIDIGIPWLPADYPHIKDNLVINPKDLQIVPGVMLHSDIPRSTEFEGPPNDLFTGSKQDPVPDMMKDEQMLVFERRDTIDVILGCSHPGIINCLRYALALYPGKQIGTVLAGMHLQKAKLSRIDETIRQFEAMDIAKLIPLHCTGITGICRMTQALGDRCLLLCTGQTAEI